MKLDPYYENLLHHYKNEFLSHWRGLIGLLLLALFIVNIQGCATAGYENVDTTRKAIVVANAEIRDANLLLQELVKNDSINDRDALKALIFLRDAHAALETAQDALALQGDVRAAESGLQRANVVLNLAIALLSTSTGEP